MLSPVRVVSAIFSIAFVIFWEWGMGRMTVLFPIGVKISNVETIILEDTKDDRKITEI